MYAGSNPASGNSGIAKRLSNRNLKVRILHVFLIHVNSIGRVLHCHATAGQTAPERSLLKMSRKKVPVYSRIPCKLNQGLKK